MSMDIAFHGTLLREDFQTLPIERYSKTWLERREGGRSIESSKDSAGHLVSRKACFSFPQGARLPRKACIFHAQREKEREEERQPFGIFIRPLYFQLTFPKLLNRAARHRHQRFWARSFQNVDTQKHTTLAFMPPSSVQKYQPFCRFNFN